MTVEQKIKTLQSDSSIRIFNRLIGTEYFYGSLRQFKSYSNKENYDSVKDCKVITTLYRSEVYFMGVDNP